MIVRPSGDTLLLVEWDGGIDPAVNRRVIAVATALRARLGPEIRDIVPGYSSIGIHFDPLRVDLVALERAIDDEAGRAEALPPVSEPQPIEIPVVYGGAAGPDLESVAEWAHLSTDGVIALHAATVYRVYMLGFVPGFAYLGRVPDRIAAPRRRTPRDRVPSGSIGIAGAQTGVYPMETPGGWQLIGRTTTTMFDARRQPPNLLRAGDAVRFVPD